MYSPEELKQNYFDAKARGDRYAQRYWNAQALLWEADQKPERAEFYRAEAARILEDLERQDAKLIELTARKPYVV